MAGPYSTENRRIKPSSLTILKHLQEETSEFNVHLVLAPPDECIQQAQKKLPPTRRQAALPLEKLLDYSNAYFSSADLKDVASMIDQCFEQFFTKEQRGHLMQTYVMGLTWVNWFMDTSVLVADVYVTMFSFLSYKFEFSPEIFAMLFDPYALLLVGVAAILIGLLVSYSHYNLKCEKDKQLRADYLDELLENVLFSKRVELTCQALRDQKQQLVHTLGQIKWETKKLEKLPPQIKKDLIAAYRCVNCGDKLITLHNWVDVQPAPAPIPPIQLLPPLERTMIDYEYWQAVLWSFSVTALAMLWFYIGISTANDVVFTYLISNDGIFYSCIGTLLCSLTAAYTSSEQQRYELAAEERFVQIYDLVNTQKEELEPLKAEQALIQRVAAQFTLFLSTRGHPSHQEDEGTGALLSI